MSEFVQTKNPYTLQELEKYFFHSHFEVNNKLDRAFMRYQENLAQPLRLEEKQRLLNLVADRLDAEREKLAQMMIQEIGKPQSEGLAEVNKSIQAFRYVSENLNHFLANGVSGLQKHIEIVKQPVGPILAIMPWNYPLWQVVRILTSSLAIGNPVLLKHAENVSGFAQCLEEVFTDELQDYLLNLRVPHSAVEAIIADRRIRAVSLTGSVRAGRVIGALAGGYIKKSVLELGGEDAYIVCQDANLEMAAKICAQARMVNNGQSCIAMKRVFVEKSIETDFLEKLTRELAKYIPMDPQKPESLASCLAGEKFKICLGDQCQMILDNGGKKIWSLSDSIGGEFEQHPCQFPAKIFAVDNMQKDIGELFGPVIALRKFEGEKQLISQVNSSKLGLGAAIFSKDLERAHQLALKLEVGLVGINSQVKSDVRYPFGGCKDSGYGSELGFFGFDEFVSKKVLIKDH